LSIITDNVLSVVVNVVATSQQEQALRIFSMLLLRLRDGKTRGIRPRGVLMGLTKGGYLSRICQFIKLFDDYVVSIEIISAAKEEGGYPDSDDEGTNSLCSSVFH
jgi:hypothetical protein